MITDMLGLLQMDFDHLEEVEAGADQVLGDLTPL